VSTVTLLRAIVAASKSTSASVALSTKRSADDVQRHLSPAIRWLTARVEGVGSSEEPTPIIAQEYVDRLRSHLVKELAPSDQLDAREIVRVLALLEELSEAWKRTDRGKFMARLTGSESASAVVAIAHDIRSPLSSILILVESLRRGRGAVTNPIHERQLGLIYGATQGLTTLASDLIDAARGEELVEGDARPFSLVETMHSVSTIVQPIAEEKGLQLHIENPTADARVGHSSPLHRVLLNLTSNALRYTDSGSVTLGCREASPSRVEFWVQDTGRGLPPKVQETLFDAFRPEQVSLRFSSAGLGFATVRALLAAMGSTLVVKTCHDRGTRLSFELELPPSPR
jgi:signal transduction histidine kinase